jgi:class I fructose-bisphosphate aldolase
LSPERSAGQSTALTATLNELSESVDSAKTAIINKRASGMGLISGRKAFQRPMNEGVKLLNVIQDVYLDRSITVA